MGISAEEYDRWIASDEKSGLVYGGDEVTRGPYVPPAPPSAPALKWWQWAITIWIVGCFVVLVVMAIVQGPQDKAPTYTPTTVPAVSTADQKACAAEAIAEYPNDLTQQRGAYNLCLALQRRYDSQASNLTNSN